MAKSKNHPRWLEFIPGFLTWGTFIFLTVCAFISPMLLANFLLIYAIFWLIKSFLMSGRLLVGYRQYRKDIKKDWLAELKTDFPDKWQDVFHLAIIATYKEDKKILEQTIEALVESDYPKDKIIVTLATEERDGERVRPIAKELKKRYEKVFYDFIVTEHPANIAGEVIGKGGNITWAGKQVQAYLDKNKISYDRVICTTLDADNRAHKKYFSALSYLYLSHPKPLYATFQPIPMFLNNIWYVPTAMRSIALGSSFWQIIESTRPHRLRNFSSHAQSFAAIVATQFWSTQTIVEDGHQYWRSYFKFNGKHDVVPINVPIYQDAVLSPHGYIATFKEQYLQKRRWAWGASDIPYVLHHIWGNSNLPFWDKWLQAIRLIEGHYSWATTSVILAIFPWLPRLLNPSFQDEIIAHTFSPFYGRILISSLLGIVITLSISMLLLPPRPKSQKFRSLGSVLLEWVTAPFILPFSNIFFSSVPAIDSQTRLMLGKYLEFRVTEKHAERQDLSGHKAAQ